MTSVAEEWEERVDSFMEDNRLLLDDPELGLSAAQRLLTETLNLLASLIWATGDAAETLTPAAEALAHAIRDPHCSAGKIHKREKAHERLKAEYERLLAAQERLEGFRDEAQAALDRIQEHAAIEARDFYFSALSQEDVQNIARHMGEDLAAGIADGLKSADPSSRVEPLDKNELAVGGEWGFDGESEIDDARQTQGRMRAWMRRAFGSR